MTRWTQGGREFITYNNMLFARSVRLAYMHTGITNLKLILLSDLFFKIFSMARQLIFLEFLSSIHIKGRYLPAQTLDVNNFFNMQAKIRHQTWQLFLKFVWDQFGVAKTLLIKFDVTIMTIAF